VRVKLPLVTIAVLSAVALLCCCGTQSPAADSSGGFAEYFGMPQPGLTPQPFAPDVFPPDGAVMHSAPAFSSDGTEVYFSAYFPDQDPRLDVIMSLEREGDRWSSPHTAAFSGQFNDDWPWFSPDGDRIYFSSQRPQGAEDGAAGQDGLWYVELGEGVWSSPTPIVSPADFGRDEGPIYVAAAVPGGYGDMDIYRLEYVDGSYSMPQNLGPAVNTEAEEYGPCAPRDEGYVVFTRFEQAAERSVGLYVSFRLEDGTWSEAQDMGSSIAAFQGARFPALSPDGKYLFFVLEGGESVYWVDAGVVEQFRPE